MDQQRLLHQFIQRTGLELEAAASILRRTDWDLVESYRMFDNLVKIGKIKPVQPPMHSRLSSAPGMTGGQPSRSSAGPGMTINQPSRLSSNPGMNSGQNMSNAQRYSSGQPRQESYPRGTALYRGPQPQERIIPIQVEKPRPLSQAAGRTSTPPPMVKRPVSQQVQYRDHPGDRYPGEQSRLSGDPNRYQGNQNRFQGGHDRYPGDMSAGHNRLDDRATFQGDQTRLSGDQGRFQGDHNRMHGDQGRLPGDHCRLPGDQGKFHVQAVKPQTTSYQGTPGQYMSGQGRGLEINSRSNAPSYSAENGQIRSGIGSGPGQKISIINIQGPGQHSATETENQKRSDTSIQSGNPHTTGFGSQVKQQSQVPVIKTHSQAPRPHSEVLHDNRVSPPRMVGGSLPQNQMTTTQRPVSEIVTSGKHTSTGKPDTKSADVTPTGDQGETEVTGGLDTKASHVTPSSPRPLKRGFSKIVENESLVSATRSSLLHDIEEDSHDHMYVQTFVLPDLTIFSSDYRAFLEKDLVETSTLVSLEQAGRLNWWAEMGICQRLLPMATSGDGNCLLHAASLAMWGIHDRELMLRKALYDTLTQQTYSKALYRRWRWQQTQVNKESGLIFSEDEWQQEWKGILKLASSRPRSLPGMSRRSSSCCDSAITQGGETLTPVVYESLEEFHVFVLAHVLQRAIIVVADTILKDSHGDALAPIPFGGIYLPLETESKSCYKSPLLLTYDAAHFSALVPMEKQSSPPTDDKSALPAAVPLVGPDLVLLPLHFVVDPGAGYDWGRTNCIGVSVCNSLEDRINLLQQFLDMDKLPILCESDYDSDARSTGSYESDENLGCIGKDKKRDSKMSQQIQNMTKQFGSLGKSVGKKLRKNFGSVGKALKSMGPDSEKGKRVGGVTQSTKIPLTIAAMSDQEQTFVWCAKLSVSHSQTHRRMINNYLQDSELRFKQDRELMRPSREEIRRRSLGTYADGDHLTKCVTSNCNMYGNPETCYLCSKCFSEQRLEALEKEKLSNKSTNPPNPSKGSDPVIKKCGQSMFYISPDEVADDDAFVTDPKLLASKSSAPTSQLNNKLHTNVMSARDRTPSPDYDNVEYKTYNKTAPHPSGPGRMSNSSTSGHSTASNPSGPVHASVTQPKMANTANKGVGAPCRTAGCTFFGTEATQFYCSACFKNSAVAQKPHGYIVT
ncbi:OTU domain-containing protein 7A-like [Pecten maximus]|uniref:OTU domain-containing protein 7A-like n=1 Tax=Pecten maximus TaxID=6579 RepID=UPI001458B270|nr:OTU domain-containing protein 7A-like [Pecten maximus]